jgi:hypothetical protein
MLKMNGYLGPSFFDDSVESVDYVLRMAGFETRISINTILIDALNIIWGAGTHLGSDLHAIESVAKPGNCIIFNMEQISGESTLVNTRYLQFLHNYRVLDYNQHNIEALKAVDSSIVASEFPLIPAPSLAFFDREASSGAFDYEFDIGFFGVLNERRERILSELQSNGLRVNRVSGQFGQNLNKSIASTRIVLNIHCYSAKIFETARVLRPLAMGIPVISETSVTPINVNWNDSGVIFADYKNLTEICMQTINNAALLDISSRRSLSFVGENTRWAVAARNAIHILGA